MILNSSWGYYVLSTPTPLKLLLHFTCIIKRIRKYLRKDPAARKARASGAPIAKKICLSIYPRNFGTHVIVRPPPYSSVPTTGIPMWRVTLSSQCGPFLIPWCYLILYIQVMVNWQLSKQGIRCPVSHNHIAGSGADPSSSEQEIIILPWLTGY